MTNDYTMEDLLDFLTHSGDRGFVPAATAQALAVASRNVLGILEESEKKNIGALDLNAVIKRFNNKRAKDFSPASLNEYGRRVHRAIELYEQWKENPADFSVKTRAPRRQKKDSQTDRPVHNLDTSNGDIQPSVSLKGTFQSSFPVGTGRIITVSNIPDDFTSTEAEKLAQFVRMLAVD